MRKLLAVLVLAVVFTLGTTFGALAVPGPVTILVNGRLVSTDVPAFIQDGRTMVPLRFVAEALGARVQWDEANRRVLITLTGSAPVSVPVVERPPVQPPTPVEPPAPAEPPATGDVQSLTAAEARMVELVNAERSKAGAPPLAVDLTLTRLARQKSADMIKLNYFDHQSPTYGSPFDMMKAAGVTYRTAGENLAGAPTVDRAHTSLMNSPGHRRNILNPAFTHIGIGIVEGGPYGLMITQMFIGK